MMTLYSSPTGSDSHRTRIALAEKDITASIIDVDPTRPPDDFLSLSPNQILPTLVDRDLVLYDARVIMEYLDERFPHPPLLPLDPVNRARFRLLLARIDRDWYSQIPILEGNDNAERNRARARLTDEINAANDLFIDAKPYFRSDTFSMVDCTMAPLLWRLNYYGIALSPNSRALDYYSNVLFSRKSFQDSLTTAEKHLRPELMKSSKNRRVR